MFNRSVDSITASLNKMVTKLQQHQQQMAERVRRFGDEIARLEHDRMVAVGEAERAAATAQKIAALVE